MTPEERALALWVKLQGTPSKRDDLGEIERALEAAVLEERKACALLADRIWECYANHPNDCACCDALGVPSGIGTAILSRAVDSGEKVG